MSKGIDIVALLEWADRQKAFKPPKKSFGRKPKMKEFNLVDLLRQKKEEATLLENYMKEQEKLNKKDDKPEKKDPSRTLSFLEWYIIGALSYPLLGPLYHMVVK